MKRLKSLVTGAHVGLGSVAAFISALILVGDQLTAFRSSKVYLWGYALLMAFRWELLGLLLVIVTWPIQKRVLLDAVNAVRESRRSARKTEEYLSLLPVVVVLLSMLTFTGYQASRYVEGKRAYWGHFGEVMADRAILSFEGNDTNRASVRLEVGAEVFRNRACRELRQALKERLALAEAMRTLAGRLPPGNWGRLKLLNAAFANDLDVAAFNWRIDEWKALVREMTGAYTGAVRLIAANRLPEARPALAAIQRRYSGFGDCHVLIGELDSRLQRGSAPAPPTPYLDAIARYGPEQFVREVLLRYEHIQRREVTYE